MEELSFSLFLSPPSLPPILSLLSHLPPWKLIILLPQSLSTGPIGISYCASFIYSFIMDSDLSLLCEL